MHLAEERPHAHTSEKHYTGEEQPETMQPFWENEQEKKLVTLPTVLRKANKTQVFLFSWTNSLVQTMFIVHKTTVDSSPLVSALW